MRKETTNMIGAAVPEQDNAPQTGRPATREEVELGMLKEVPLLRRRALQLCRDANLADDLVQDVMLRALEKAHLWTSGTDLRAWLMAIMRNRFFSDIRLRRRRRVESLDDAARYISIAPGQDVWIEIDSLRTGLASLREENRDLLLSVSVRGERYDEAARRCGMPLGTIRSRVHRARAQLQAVVNPGSTNH